MPRGTIFTATLVLTLGCAFASPAVAQRSSDDDDQDSGSEKAPEKKSKRSIPTMPRISLIAKLPEAYRDKDKNGDGQIGLYEWPRKDLAAFRKLDRNGDGFLTAAELIAGPGKSSSSSTTSVASTSKPGDSSSSGSSSSSGASTSGTSGSSTTGSSSSSGTTAAAAPTSAADIAFVRLDKDGNGSVNSEEWQRSILVKSRFEKNGLNPTFPMNKDEFAKLYQQLK